MQIKLFGALSLFAFSATAAVAQDGWTDSAGGKTISAEFVKLDGVQLTLRKPDGKEVVIALSKLDDKSRLKARAMAKNGVKPSAGVITDNVTSEAAKSTGPVPFPTNPSAKEFVDIVTKELNNKNSIVVWDALPVSKQKQVQAIVKLASTKIEQRTLNQVKRFRSDLLTALKSKKQFILNSPAIPISPDQKQQLTSSYDSIVALIEGSLPEQWMDSSYLQQTDLREIATNYIDNINVKSKDLEKTLASGSPFIAMINQTLPLPKVESADSKEAMIAFPLPGMPPNAIKFVLSDGRWLPEALLASWDQAMMQAKTVLEKADPKEIHKGVGQGLLFANGLLGTISTAETQQDFDDAIGQLMGMAQMIPGLGGGMAPGGPAAF